MSLAVLRQQLAALSPPPRATGAVIPTGIAALDAVLSGGGLPSGRLSEVTGRRGSGRTTLVRQLVASAVSARRWVAVIDGTRTLAPREWASLGDSGRLWVIRPPSPDQGPWCADVLLRSGAFSLVVLDGGPALPRQVAVRLTRLARDHDAALVVSGETGSGVVGSAVRLRLARAGSQGSRPTMRPGAGHDSRVAGHGSRVAGHDSRVTGRGSRVTDHEAPVTHNESRITIAVDKGGSHHSVEVCCAIDVARRLCAHPEVPDRRGVAARNRQGARVDSPHRRTAGTAGSRPQRAAHTGGQDNEPGAVASGTLPYKRRCAEPLVRREEFLLGPPPRERRPKQRTACG